MWSKIPHLKIQNQIPHYIFLEKYSKQDLMCELCNVTVLLAPSRAWGGSKANERHTSVRRLGRTVLVSGGLTAGPGRGRAEDLSHSVFSCPWRFSLPHPTWDLKHQLFSRPQEIRSGRKRQRAWVWISPLQTVWLWASDVTFLSETSFSKSVKGGVNNASFGPLQPVAERWHSIDKVVITLCK